MSDEKPTIHIDSDWKRQAQEEKRRLAEQERQKAAASKSSVSSGPILGGVGMSSEPQESPSTQTSSAGRELPPASFSTLVQSLVTQVYFYLGELVPRGGQPVIDLDSAKHNIDLLGVLEEKTKGNLTPEETRLLETALYELRMRFVNVASQMIR